MLENINFRRSSKNKVAKLFGSSKQTVGLCTRRYTMFHFFLTTKKHSWFHILLFRVVYTSIFFIMCFNDNLTPTIHHYIMYNQYICCCSCICNNQKKNLGIYCDRTIINSLHQYRERQRKTMREKKERDV
jgi:hypothetical protein